MKRVCPCLEGVTGERSQRQVVLIPLGWKRWERCSLQVTPNSWRGDQPVRATGLRERDSCLLPAPPGGLSQPPGPRASRPTREGRAAGRLSPSCKRAAAVCSSEAPAGPWLTSGTTYWPQGEKQRLSSGRVPQGLSGKSLRGPSHPFTHRIVLWTPSSTQGQKANSGGDADAQEERNRKPQSWLVPSDPGDSLHQKSRRAEQTEVTAE